MSSDPLFLCCQSSVAGTSHFGIYSRAQRYSDLTIPSSLKLLARVHSGDLAHQCPGLFINTLGARWVNALASDPLFLL